MYKQHIFFHHRVDILAEYTFAIFVRIFSICRYSVRSYVDLEKLFILQLILFCRKQCHTFRPFEKMKKMNGEKKSNK